ncbi:hypothetical protein [Aureivirga sp. CE67]|uniref:hypothetical protein n=1 Tax=Aureivirga sp. CE67 TaxID=1788983 RepID=UPI0018C9651C|nr:hypothetical protein [Aureivirga sp. CE67]
MKKHYLFVLLLIVTTKFFAQGLEKNQQEMVKTFIDYIENKDVNKLKKIVRYPLRRAKPLSAIKNESEFKRKFKEIFDQDFMNMIVNSDINKDWSQVGSNGIMFKNGALWLGLNGNLIAVNYQSKKGDKKVAKISKKSSRKVHESLKVFKKPILVMETKKFRVRVDQLENGTYRYASWPLDSKMTDKPSLVLKNGRLIPDGSGGNHKYKFTNVDYTYECYINELGTNDSPDAYLMVFRGRKEILSQDAKIVSK